MPLGRSFSVALLGVHGAVVECEADLADGLPGFVLVGLPDASLGEAKDRVRAAISNTGLSWPQRRITVGLLPATLPKAGSSFDLALALGILCANGQIPQTALGDQVVLGELGLDGRVHGVRGVLPMVLGAAREGRERFVVPWENVAEARLVPGVEVVGVRHLGEAFALFAHGVVPEQPASHSVPHPRSGHDLSQVGGQRQARRALEIAAAGGHHLFMLGAPGAGKTMLAERLPTILPPLSDEWALEVSAIHSVAGLLAQGALVRQPPFCAPHHTTTVAALVGGGSTLIRPGELSCAHRGALFLDEAPEFNKGVLDAMRQPLESGVVQISRAKQVVEFPCRTTLVLAANPCPCAKTKAQGGCRCTVTARRRYLHKLSGPLMDRIDMRVLLEPVTRADLMRDVQSIETSEIVGARVLLARERAAQRLSGTPWLTTGEVPPHELRERWPVREALVGKLANALKSGAVSMRGYDRVIRIAWTLADLAGELEPGEAEIGEALALRMEFSE